MCSLCRYFIQVSLGSLTDQESSLVKIVDCDATTPTPTPTPTPTTPTPTPTMTPTYSPQQHNILSTYRETNERVCLSR